MRIELDLPDEIAQALQASDLSRAALEALALEGYRSRLLGNGQIRRMLGFNTPMQVHEFLKKHGVILNYSVEDLEKDLTGLESFRKKAEEFHKRSA